ncbi:MAG: transglutaminase-like domain-containing protein [Cyclobacteriaceae bacterium]|nr:transglutaminase-like domain-containing protein [Cyclobacteriaceae bacterium]
MQVQKKDFPKDEDHRLFLAPVQFGMEGYVGQMQDWAGLSKWQFELNAGRDVLPENFRLQILELTKDAKSDFEKIQVLYSFLQKNFRYVSIQLGIGGWQTSSAEDVLKSSSGDCKGLTNLMKAMLKEVGIESQEALVFAGVEEEDIEVDMVSHQFNHVILRAHAEGNPVWLECTSSTLPAGFLGDFTKNRHVLLIQESGGHLLKTPAYSSRDWNQVKIQGQIQMDIQGNAKIKNELQFAGNPVEAILDVKSKLDERQQRDYLNRKSSISGLLVDNFQITLGHQDSIPVANISYDGFIQRFSQNTAKRILLKPFFLKISSDQLNNQSFDLLESYEIVLTDSWELEGGIPLQEVEGEYFSGYLKGEQHGEILRLSRNITVELPKDFPEDQKSELIKKINSSLDKVFSFSKPTLTISK